MPSCIVSKLPHSAFEINAISIAFKYLKLLVLCAISNFLKRFFVIEQRFFVIETVIEQQPQNSYLDFNLVDMIDTFRIFARIF